MDSDRHLVQVFPARMGALGDVAAFAAQAGRAAGLGRDAGLRLALLVEELFTNTVVHGHRRDTDEPVMLAFAVAPGRLALTYEDTGPPYDPFAVPAAPDERAGVEERPVGGLGLVLVAAMARDVCYSRAEDKNRISLVITG